MVPMRCPSCGRKGNAPSDHANVRMHCPKCDAVFHMDKHGKVKLGEPVVEGHKDAGGHGRGKSSDEPYATSITELVKKSPWPVKLVLVGLVAAALWPVIGPRFASKPEDLESDVARRFAYTFADEKFDELKAFAAPGTADALKQWYERLRPRFQFKRLPGEAPGTRLTYAAIPQVEDEGQRVRLAITLGHTADTPIPAVVEQQKLDRRNRKRDGAPGYDYIGNFTLPTMWVKDNRGRWWLDGEATLAMANRQ